MLSQETEALVGVMLDIVTFEGNVSAQGTGKLIILKSSNIKPSNVVVKSSSRFELSDLNLKRNCTLFCPNKNYYPHY